MFSLRTLIAVVALCSLPLHSAPADEKSADGKPDAELPHWLWSAKDAQERETVYFRKTFDLPNKPKSALLSATCDNVVTVWVNGQQVVRHDDWTTAPAADVSKVLAAGNNVIAAECRNEGGPAGFILVLAIETEDGKKVRVLSDPTWKESGEAPEGWSGAGFDDSGWKPAFSLGTLGIAPWRNIAIDGRKIPATAVSELTLLPGFTAELLYSVPKATQGSWVSMTPDPKGRLIVSDQSGSLYRVTPGPSEAETEVEKIDLPIGSAQGLLYVQGALYVVVNGSVPGGGGSGLYRVRDLDGDDVFDRVELLKKFDGGGEHGPHGLRLGPDGALYVIAGNFTRVPEGSDPLSPHRNFAEDLLLRRNPDGNGFATGVLAPGGWICRTDLDGKEWQLFCAGFRNPYDIAFSAEGEIFTYDADMEWDTGTPWYRPTRVNHAVSGAEFGWRYGTGKWPANYVDSVGAVADIGLGSPTGIEFGTGARFPERYQRALFINDWTYGKMYAVHLEPAGATYTASFETFVSGRPLPLTDVCINRDGAMYFTIGGRSAQSGLYRVTYTGPEPATPAARTGDAAAERARELRRKLESFHSGTAPEAVAFAWPHVNSADRAIRYAARVAVEHQDLAIWKDRALNETRPNALIQALTALCRAGSKELQPAVLARLNSLPFKRLTEEQFADALRVYELAFIRLGGKQPESAATVVATLNPLFPAQSESVNRGLCTVLTYLEAPGVIERSLAQLAAARTQQDQMFYVFTLRNLEAGWTIDQRKTFFGWLGLARGYQGGASFKKFIDQIRDDALARLSEGERTALKDVIEGASKVDTVKLATTRQFIHNWQLADLAPLVDRAGAGRSFEKGEGGLRGGAMRKVPPFPERRRGYGPRYHRRRRPLRRALYPRSAARALQGDFGPVRQLDFRALGRAGCHRTGHQPDG